MTEITITPLADRIPVFRQIFLNYRALYVHYGSKYYYYEMCAAFRNLMRVQRLYLESTRPQETITQKTQQ